MKLIFLFVFSLSLLQFSCENEENLITTPGIKVEPTIIADSASSISWDSAVLNGSLNPKGILTTYYFEYGPTLEYGFSTPVDTLQQDTILIKIQSSIVNLSPGSLYYWRIVAQNINGIYHSSDSSFTTFIDYFPLSVGNIWNYNYTGFYAFLPDTNAYKDSGTMIWEIKSSTINNDTIEYVFLEKSDLIRIYWMRGDTISLSEERFFSIKQIHNQLMIPNHNYFGETRIFARYYSIDTPVEIDIGHYYYTDRFILLREKGLLEYYYYFNRQNYTKRFLYRLAED